MVGDCNWVCSNLHDTLSRLVARSSAEADYYGIANGGSKVSS